MLFTYVAYRLGIGSLRKDTVYTQAWELSEKIPELNKVEYLGLAVGVSGTFIGTKAQISYGACALHAHEATLAE